MKMGWMVLALVVGGVWLGAAQTSAQETAAPAASAKADTFTNPVLEQIATKHGKSVAQTVLRWHYQRGIVAIPRSSNPDHRRENLAIFDFSLDADDMHKISALDENRSQFPEWT